MSFLWKPRNRTCLLRRVLGRPRQDYCGSRAPRRSASHSRILSTKYTFGEAVPSSERLKIICWLKKNWHCVLLCGFGTESSIEILYRFDRHLVGIDYSVSETLPVQPVPSRPPTTEHSRLDPFLKVQRCQTREYFPKTCDTVSGLNPTRPQTKRCLFGCACCLCFSSHNSEKHRD
jgi:hypothetical protein